MSRLTKPLRELTQFHSSFPIPSLLLVHLQLVLSSPIQLPLLRLLFLFSSVRVHRRIPLPRSALWSNEFWNFRSRAPTVIAGESKDSHRLQVLYHTSDDRGPMHSRQHQTNGQTNDYSLLLLQASGQTSRSMGETNQPRLTPWSKTSPNRHSHQWRSQQTEPPPPFSASHTFLPFSA
jgi:hypothetical protein